MKAADQGFRQYGATLETLNGPYDKYNKSGDPDDPASYLARPGVDFQRPWLAIVNGPAFQWPLGLQGYTLSIDPTLGIHKFIGDNKVAIDVLHAGEEHFVMTGSFPGNSGPDLIQALRDLVYQQADERVGKLLYVPEIFTYAQRVQVFHFESSRADTDRGRDTVYSIEFVRIGTANDALDGITTIPQVPQPKGSNKGKSTRTVKTTTTLNTARKIAAARLGNTNKWRQIYNLNTKVYTSRHVALASVPDYRLAAGLTIHY